MGWVLSEQQQQDLREAGFVNLGVLLDRERRHRVTERIDELLRDEGDQAGAELAHSPHIRHPREKGADRLADLVNKDPMFDAIWTHPLLLAAIGCVLKSFKLSSLNYRSAKPGFGAQKLHADWADAVPPGDTRVCNAIWLLDEFTSHNGATRLVPGSHLQGNLPESAMADPWATHPAEVLLEAPAGSVVVFNSHVWHGGTVNRSDRPRRAIHSYFCRSDQPQQLDQAQFLTCQTRQRLSADHLRLLLGRST